ncbi:MAG TPA: LamG-like jellyroll fold domain-containing protein [Verrucomicrobiae bacterium]|nr:LamG-like jellyroll fold domain-containing protein [Verrucomicrobiae bacterium]
MKITSRNAAALAAAFVCCAASAFAQADASPTTVGYWKMNHWSTNLPFGSGVTEGIADLATNAGQGTLTGGTPAPAAEDDLYVWGDMALDFQIVNDAPPASMFNRGFDGGGASWNSAHNLNAGGQMFFAQDQFGNEFAGPSFTEEIFFKSAGPSAVKQTLIWNHQSSAYAHLQVNEDGNTGDLTFWGYDGANIQAVRLGNGPSRFDDGMWHCAVCRFDAASKVMSLVAISEDGTSSSNSITLTQNLNPEGANNFYIGRTEGEGDRFNGEINQVRFSSAALPASQLLADAGSAQAHTIAYWQMNGTVNNLAENGLSGVGILDLATNVGQGVLNGSAADSGILPSVDNLFVNGPSLPDNIVFDGIVPPTSMFNAAYPYNPGQNSWDCGASADAAGQVYFPHDVYGDELSTPSFTEEIFFRATPQANVTKQTLIFNHQNSAYANLQLNESADSVPDDLGSLLFWSFDGANIITLRMTAVQNGGERFDDGAWHYAACRFDAATKVMSLLVVNEDGTSSAVTQTLANDLYPGANAGDTIIGNDGDSFQSVFYGLINQVRFSDVALPNQELLANVPECIPPTIAATSQPITNYVGDVAYVAVSAGGISPLYQWRFNGTNIAGATNSLYAVFPVEVTNGGNYDVVVSTACGLALTSAPIRLTVIPTVRPPVNIARWSMDAQINAPNNNGDPAFNGVADSDTNSGQGVFGGPISPAIDDLITFNAASGGVAVTNDAPPTGMFINGNNGGVGSYYAAALNGVDGALFYPQDQYGDEFDFQTAFSIELFFKTLGNQSGAGKMELIAQGSDGGQTLRYGVDVNEAAPGSVTFALQKNGNYQAVSLTNANYADGSWHYLLAQYDALGNQIILTVVDQNAVAHIADVTLPAGFGPLPSGNNGNAFIGRFNYAFNPPNDDPRTFLGMIDEIQISSGLVTPATGQLGLVPTTVTPHITGITVSGGNVTVTFTGSPSDNASAFALVGSSTVNGNYANLSAAITSLGSGNFQAVIAQSGATEFYRVRR